MNCNSQLPWSEVQSFYEGLLGESLTVAKACIEKGSADATKTVKNYLGDTDFRAYIGAEKDDLIVFGEIVPKETITYSEWLLNLWGRKIYTYLSIFERGLACSNKCCAFMQYKIGESTLKKLSKIRKSLEEGFKRKSFRSFTEAQSLTERRDIVNFHITYLDPILFSTLVLLREKAASFRESGNMRPWDIIEEEVSSYTREGSDKIATLADESSLWWGINTLIKEIKNGRSFEIGQYSDYQGAIEICMNLISKKPIVHPEKQLLWTEATPEIYGKTRTYSLILKNCVEILENIPDNIRESTQPKFAPFLEQLIYSILNTPTRTLEHLYFKGVLLESIAPYLCFVAKKRTLKPPTGRDNLTSEKPVETEQSATHTRSGRIGTCLWKLYEKTLKVIVDAILERFWPK